jgi:hypothetical protein
VTEPFFTERTRYLGWAAERATTIRRSLCLFHPDWLPHMPRYLIRSIK